MLKSAFFQQKCLVELNRCLLEINAQLSEIEVIPSGYRDSRTWYYGSSGISPLLLIELLLLRNPLIGPRLGHPRDYETVLWLLPTRFP